MALISTGTTYGSVGVGSVYAPNVIGTSRVAAPITTMAAPMVTSAPIIRETIAAPMVRTIAAPIAAPQVLEYSEPVLIDTISAPGATYLEPQTVQQQGAAVPFPMGPLPAVACRVEGVGASAAYNDLRQQRDASQQSFWSMRQGEAQQTFQIGASTGATGPIEEGFAVTGGFAPTIIQAAPVSYIGGATIAQPTFVETIGAPAVFEQVVEPGYVVDTFAAPTVVETFAAPTVVETFAQPTMIA